MKKNITNNTNTPPTVKWGSLIFSFVGIITEVILIALNIYANTGKMAEADLALGFIAAYGWLFGAFALMGGLGVFFEEFLPSYRSYQKWEKKKAKLEAQRQAQQKADLDAYENLRKYLGYRN